MSAEPTTTVASLADVLRHIASEIDNFMPEPSHVTYYTYPHRAPIVGLTFNVEGAACVETWAAKYGTPRPTRQPRNESEWLTTDSFEFMGLTFQLAGHDPREPEPVATQPEPVADWSQYGECPDCGMVAGRACVFVSIVNMRGEPRTTPHPERPLVETIDESAVLEGEVTSPFGPCHGLAADRRDNTCTNFAAEYVGYLSTTTGLIADGVFSPATQYSRLCKSCADSIPNVIERRPLTTTPGGYPVERA